MKKFLNNPTRISLFFLVIFLAITYLPNINQLGYYNDDWWQIFGAEKYGVERFSEMYSADRPARAFLHAPLYSLFGSQILPYHILGLVIRWLGAVGLFWTLTQIWGKKTKELFIMSLLFLIYPGFLQQPNAFDYLTHHVAMTLMIFSIGLSVKYLHENLKIKKLFYFIFSSLFALNSYFLMDYYVGMEIYRWLIIGYLHFRQYSGGSIKKLIQKIILEVIPFSFSIIIFLFWRIFLYQGTRYTTDLGRIGSNFLNSPIIGIFNIFRRWFIDVGDVFVSIWTDPSFQKLSDLQSDQFLIALILGLISIGILIIYFKSSPIVEKKEETDQKWLLEAAVLGFLGAVICLIPINIVEREVSFPTFNRFSYPSSIGVSIATIALIAWGTRQRWQSIIYSLLIFSSVLIHYTNNDYFAKQWLNTKESWQEWIWRVPGIKEETMLTGYFTGPIQEGFFVWSPVNLLYYTSSPEIMVGAEVLNKDTAKDIITQNTFVKNQRSFYFQFNYSDTLVFSKPNSTSCLRFIDKDQIELSVHDNPLISQVAPYSHIEKITGTNTLNQEMYTNLFGNDGSEPTWCYIYEKASLARQFGDWQIIKDLHATAHEHDLRPYDPIEWFPFLQAYAYLGMEDEVDQLAPIINETPYYRHQACQIFSQKEYNPDPDIQSGNQFLAETFCD